MKQKYRRGDRVLLKKEFPSSMSHFSFKGKEIIIQYSYSDRYGRPGHGGGYAVLGPNLKGNGRHSSAWYEIACIEKLISRSAKKDMALLEKHWND